MSPPAKQLGAGQVALELDTSVAPAADQARDLVRISDPALSELPFEALLNELLIRVQDLLDVDTAAILLLDAERQELVARAAKGIEEEVEQGVRIPLGRGFAGRIAQERVAIFIADVDHADILNPILRQKGIRSLLGVPLIVEGDLIGVLHVGSLQPRNFDARDLAVLELASARAAPAIERGRLVSALEREHRNAMMLQRSLLPRTLGAVPNMTIAARYLPARDEVGGDWYDLVELPRGQVGVVIGDVVGHGLDAALLMGQLRTALHAYAIDGRSPGETLEQVDRFAVRLGPEAMATAAYAVVDGDTGSVRFAGAGHLPPVIIPPSGTARSVELSVAPPLGALGHRTVPEHSLQLEPGETLMLYTDGLIERPRVPLPHSMAELVEAVSGASTPEEACLLSMDRMIKGRGPRDDVAVIALQLDPVPEILDLVLPADPTTLALLRRSLSRWLARHGVKGEVATEVLIAAGEASANAIQHAYGPARGDFSLRAERIQDTIEIRVRDHGCWRPARGQDRGRGLKIINVASDHAEVRTDEEGTEVIMRREIGPR